jgi:hypothetical protein
MPFAPATTTPGLDRSNAVDRRQRSHDLLPYRGAAQFVSV